MFDIKSGFTRLYEARRTVTYFIDVVGDVDGTLEPVRQRVRCVIAGATPQCWTDACVEGAVRTACVDIQGCDVLNAGPLEDLQSTFKNH